MNNLEVLFNIISVVLKIPIDKINKFSSKDTLDNWDSLAMVNLVTELESAFEVRFDILEIADFHSVEIIMLVLIDKGINFDT